MKHALSLLALAASMSPIASTVPEGSRPPSAKTNPFPTEASSSMRVGWVKTGDNPRNRSKTERNKRKAARRARARNAKR